MNIGETKGGRQNGWRGRVNPQNTEVRGPVEIFSGKRNIGIEKDLLEVDMARGLTARMR